MSIFNKGDKILGVEGLTDLGMYEGEVYTVRSCTGTSMTLEECFNGRTGRYYTFTPSDYELVAKRNHRNTKPTDLITISVDGVESNKEETEVNATKVETTSNKFKKGDKVTLVNNYELGVFEVLAYSSDGYCCYQKGFQGHSGNFSLGTETFVGTEYEAQCYWFLESELAIAEVSKNYREMSPHDLITISINGVESEVPLGDIVHAVAILGVTNGYWGTRIWKALRKPFDLEGFVGDTDTVVEFRDKQKEALDYFFKPYYDQLNQM